MEDIVRSLIASMPFWDDWIVGAGIMAGVSAIVVICIDIPGLFKSEKVKTVLRWACAFVLAIGITAQITGAKRLSSITTEIVAFLTDRIETQKATNSLQQYLNIASETKRLELEERVGKGDTRAAELELRIEELRKENLELVRLLTRHKIDIGTLKAAQQPRTITDAQESRAISDLKKRGIVRFKA